MSQTTPAADFEFDITAHAGDARAGELRVSGITMRTPNLFPVVNFYGGGTERSVFGGGVHRTMKELLIGANRMGGEPFSPAVDGVMTSVSSFLDYNITEERYRSYLATPIKDRDIFEPFNGMLFVDSGGYKLLNNPELDGSDFSVEMDQSSVFDMQESMGADILVNLDHPIAPDDSRAERLEKAENTAANIHEFLSLTSDYRGALYLTVHGYNYSMIDEFLKTITESVPEGVLREGFDGIALGSLVPKKDNRPALMQAVADCRELMADWNMDEWPLHVLGISSRAAPLLAAMGVDTFDSSTYLQSAINGKYNRSLMETVPIESADFSDCDCRVCQSEVLVERMRGHAEYQKDILGPVAMHNLLIQNREVAEIRRRIQQGDTDAVIEYLETTFSSDETMRKVTHQVVNQSLGGYF